MNTTTKTLAAAVVSAALFATGALAQDKDANQPNETGMGQMMQDGGDAMEGGNMMGMMPQMMEMMENCNQMMQMMQSMHGAAGGSEPKNS